MRMTKKKKRMCPRMAELERSLRDGVEGSMVRERSSRCLVGVMLKHRARIGNRNQR
jgi:hypothetical protein